MESAKKLFELIKELLRMDFMGILKSVLRKTKYMKNVIVYSLIVVCGIFSLSANLTFAQVAPTVTTGRVAYPNETSEPLCGVVYLDETSVSLYGTVNPNGLATTVWFEYGTSSGSYSNTSSTQNASGTTTQRIHSDISGLSLSTQSGLHHYYRIVAQNSVGISYGSEKYFVPIMPNFSSGVATYDATNITSNSATLKGETTTVVHDVWFELDTIDGEYFYEVNATENFPSGYSTNISGLSPATTYYYRIAGWDKLYLYYGKQKSFTTLEATATPAITPTPNLTPISSPTPALQSPTVVTGEATTNDELYSLTLNGTVNANGLLTTTWFEYGENSGSYTNTSSTQTVDGTNDTAVGIKISASEGTPYYYKIVAQNSAGTSYGNEMYIIVPVDTWWWDANKSITVSPSELTLKKKKNNIVIVKLIMEGGGMISPIENETVETEITIGKRRISISPKSAATDANGQATFTITARRAGKAKITFRAKRGQYGYLEAFCNVRDRRQ